ncbi:hypothetical protein GH984_03375 [Spiribacter sp. C176]|uniref:Anti sigma-E protein RseA N-terminal domain-containing protein n=1 Tax=Spiribacter salilacus TaxID=2664894 RepID=A0A6N7QTT4_9GAMM|nr:sigma-E factor negative regulatory protein [Spiribacter salilacus]MRH77737.1 hypothetical protein [Spiribacter salilacus]
MAGKQHEQISAYVDGELNADEQRFLWRHLAANPQARAHLIQLHEIKAALHRERVAGASSIADRVKTALADEAAHSTPNAPERRFRLSPLFQPIAGLAIAASVALGLVAVWPVTGLGPTAPTTPSVASAPPPMLSPTLPVSPAANPRASVVGATGNADVRQRLSPYFINHSEHAASGQLGGTLQYARIVGYDGE